MLPKWVNEQAQLPARGSGQVVGSYNAARLLGARSRGRALDAGDDAGDADALVRFARLSSLLSWCASVPALLHVGTPRSACGMRV